jgi:predicted ester cyclase
MGIAATGKQVSIGGIGAYRIEDGKIVEDRVAEDLMGLMQQLGVVPAPEQG